MLSTGAKYIQKHLGINQSYITFLANAVHSPQTSKEFSLEIDLLTAEDIRRFVYELIEQRNLTQQLDDIDSFMDELKENATGDVYEPLVFLVIKSI